MPVRRTTARGYRNAHELRRAQTQHEIILWNYLGKGQLQGVRFRRQHALGPYVVDFCSLSRMAPNIGSWLIMMPIEPLTWKNWVIASCAFGMMSS